MDINYKEIGERIQRARKLKGLSVADAATATGFTSQSLVHAENGQAQIALDFLLPLCTVLNVTPNDLLAGEYVSTATESLEMDTALDDLKKLIEELTPELPEDARSDGTIIKDRETTLEDIRKMVARYKLEFELQSSRGAKNVKIVQAPGKAGKTGKSGKSGRTGR